MRTALPRQIARSALLLFLLAAGCACPRCAPRWQMQRPPGSEPSVPADSAIGGVELGEAEEPTATITETAPPVDTTPPVETNSGPVIGIPARPREVAPREKKSVLEMTVDAPAHAQVGEEVTFRVRLRNVGSKPIDKVTVECELDRALSSPGRKSRRIGQEFGEVAPDLEHETELVVVADREGRHCCEFAVRTGKVEQVWKSVCIEFSAAK
ncbi:MAG TPA: hypothetical protein VHB77_15885 [Planctomycetaceae bacterium]|nr:hypothetical protein [Planctomycetaceae bacterium]